MKRLLLILWLLTAAAGSRISAAGRTELNQGWKFRQYGLGEWLPAAVPGTVHTDLLANGQIPDPFYGSSQSDLQCIDNTDWEYCCTLDASELASYDNVRLVFEGVDCYADIRLNGEMLHRTGNMFRTWKSDVKGLLKSRNNRLHVVFHSPVMQGLKNMAAYGGRLTTNNDLGALGGLGPNKVSVFTRKSGYQYGWDLAPRYVTSGLWRPVALEAWNEARVEDFHVRIGRITDGCGRLLSHPDTVERQEHPHGRQDAGCRDAFNRRAVRDSLSAVVVSQRNGRALPLRRGAGAGKRGEGA